MSPAIVYITAGVGALVVIGIIWLASRVAVIEARQEDFFRFLKEILDRLAPAARP